jgi:hypothetical protein
VALAVSVVGTNLKSPKMVKNMDLKVLEIEGHFVLQKKR